MKKSVIIALTIMLALAVSQTYGGPKGQKPKPVKIVSQPVDVNVVNTEPIPVRIEVDGVGIAVYEEGTADIACDTFGDVLMYDVPTDQVFELIFASVDLVGPGQEHMQWCLMEDASIKACLPMTSDLPIAFDFSGGTSITVRLRFVPGCTVLDCDCYTDGGFLYQYSITLMGNLK